MVYGRYRIKLACWKQSVIREYISFLIRKHGSKVHLNSRNATVFGQLWFCYTYKLLQEKKVHLHLLKSQGSRARGKLSIGQSYFFFLKFNRIQLAVVCHRKLIQETTVTPYRVTIMLLALQQSQKLTSDSS